MADKNTCAHPSCNCPVKDGEKYCSQACHDAGDSLEIACQCGHPGCSGTAVTH